ncbi:MAG TPA: tRNA (N6-threonylcarbamoyladenosine(37)-N6)-methyltransferase TrmO [Pirellulales bacterium]|jgi:tRNA-Thr(GGU) m(6)t(6)A37 methyltransferase TsaA
MLTLHEIGFVRSDRTEPIDDGWDQVTSRIELLDEFPPEALLGLAEFSHVEVIFCFDRVGEGSVERAARHPRGNKAWPRVGIFAQRAKDRPNRLGLTTVEIVCVESRTLVVKGLDAIDGTPVLDIKPVMQEFLPRTPIRQPAWSHEVMRDYW